MYETVKTQSLPSDMGDRVARIEAAVIYIVKELVEVAQKHQAAKSFGLTVSPTDCKRWVADIKTAIGDGRLTFGWRIDDRELMGVLSVQRKQYDQYDRVFWNEVWAINVPSYSDPYVGHGTDRLSIPPEDDHFNNGKYAFWKLAESIVKAIAMGPIPKAQDVP